MTHPLGLSKKITPFLQHSKLAFIFVSVRGQGYGWLLNHLSIRFASHIIFSLQHCVFLFGLIKPSAFSFLTYECEQGLEAFGTHLTCCPFGGQQIAGHTDHVQGITKC